MTIKTLEGISARQLTDVLNEAFKDYAIPMHRSVDDIAQKLVVESIDLRYSAGVFDSGRLVGLMLHGIGTSQGRKAAWNGGTGVIAALRGRKLTEQMYAFLLPALQQHGVETLSLEVLASNEPAKAVYTRLGFNTTRSLLGYKGTLTSENAASHQVVTLEGYDLVSLSSWEDAAPCWQLSNTAMHLWGDTIAALGVKAGNELAGFLLYNKSNKRICRFAVNNAHRRKSIATALFQYVSRNFSPQLTLVNMDGGDEATNAFLRASGLSLFVEQYEMKKALGAM